MEVTSPEPEGSVTRYISQLKGGDAGAIRPLWDRYFEELVRLARRTLRAAPRSAAVGDEEDVALSAFHDFLAAVHCGRFARLDDREDLWRVLVHVTACKAADQRERLAAKKRGGGRVRSESDLRAGEEGGADWHLDRVIGDTPSPEFAAQVAEEFRARIEALGDPTLRRIALMKLAGHTNEEIREALGCSLRSVTLKLELIRKRWEAERTR